MMGWLKRLLGITELEKKVSDMHEQVIKLRQDRNDMRLNIITLNNKIDAIQSLVQVGVDVHFHHGRSWAVVCIAGKPEYVQFVDLGHKDAAEIKRFIGQFDRRNVCIDAPPNTQLFFDEDIIKRKSP